jgi:hypothetical protein
VAEEGVGGQEDGEEDDDGDDAEADAAALEVLPGPVRDAAAALVVAAAHCCLRCSLLIQILAQMVVFIMSLLPLT